MRSLRASSTMHAPHEAAVEETFVNRDPQSALKLGQARGIALVVPALAGLPVTEYAANLVKKTVTGTGHAEKAQIAMMVKMLLPKCAGDLRARARRRRSRCAGDRDHPCASLQDDWRCAEHDRQAARHDRFHRRGFRHPRRAWRRLCRELLDADVAEACPQPARPLSRSPSKRKCARIRSASMAFPAKTSAIGFGCCRRCRASARKSRWRCSACLSAERARRRHRAAGQDGAGAHARRRPAACREIGH